MKKGEQKTGSTEPQATAETPEVLEETVVKGDTEALAESLETLEAIPTENPKEPESEPEEKGEAEAEPEAEGDDEGEDGELPEKLKAKIEKRIGKEVGRRKELEDKLETERAYTEELLKRVEALESKAEQPARTTTPTVFETEDEILEREEFLLDVEDFCRAHMSGYEPTKEGEKGYTAEEIAERLRAARRERVRELPKARETMKARATVEAEAAKQYPELNDPRSDLALEVRRAAREMPWLKVRPDWKVFVADALAGRKARETQSAKPKVKAKPMVAPPVAAKTPATVSKLEAQRQKSRFETFAESGFEMDALAVALE